METMSKQALIHLGLRSLRGIGLEHVCNVCISGGGSCCNGCEHLTEGVGCQSRNTSCTAWLCGFLKYVMFEMELLEDWESFWNQVPGQDYREDHTPDFVEVHSLLPAPGAPQLGEALARDLKALGDAHVALGFIFTLREKLDKSIDDYYDASHDPEKQTKIRNYIRMLSSHFYRFKPELDQYLQHKKENPQ